MNEREADEDPEEPSHRNARWLLISDLDGTLLGGRRDIEEFLAGIRACPRLRFGLNSSRPLASVRATFTDLAIAAVPDVWIGAMGTEIEIDGRRVAAWARRFRGWDRRPIDEAMASLALPPHPPEFQTEYKASFAVPPERADDAIRAIAACGLDVRIVRSGASDFDVIPATAGKGAATRFVAEHWRIPPERVVVAGDSANDLAMFEVAGLGIVVGNARAELRDRLDGARVYFARAPVAGGVLEGLRHHGVLQKESR